MNRPLWLPTRMLSHIRLAKVLGFRELSGCPVSLSHEVSIGLTLLCSMWLRPGDCLLRMCPKAFAGSVSCRTARFRHHRGRSVLTVAHVTGGDGFACRLKSWHRAACCAGLPVALLRLRRRAACVFGCASVALSCCCVMMAQRPQPIDGQIVAGLDRLARVRIC